MDTHFFHYQLGPVLPCKKFYIRLGQRYSGLFCPECWGQRQSIQYKQFFYSCRNRCCCFLVYLMVQSHRNIEKGIGLASRILIPPVFVIMTIIVVYALTLPGAIIGINALINPNWNLLFDINIWIVAFSQIIFSLGIGEALALTYASYLSDNKGLTDNVFFVVASNSSFEIFTAFGVFSILGYMSATSGTPLVELVSEGTGLIFVVFPKIFSLMGVIGNILWPLFFLAVLFAGISSAFAFFEPIISSISSKTDMSRKKLVTI